MKKLLFFIILLISYSVAVTATTTLYDEVSYDNERKLLIGEPGVQDLPDYLHEENAILSKCEITRKPIFEEASECYNCDTRGPTGFEPCYDSCVKKIDARVIELWKPIYKEFLDLSKKHNEYILNRTISDDVLSVAKQELTAIFAEHDSCMEINSRGDHAAFNCRSALTATNHQCLIYTDLNAFVDKYRKFQKEPFCSEDPDCVSQVVEEAKPKLVLKNFGEPFKKLTFSKGQVEMLRGGKVEKVTKNLEFKAGDIIHTGGDGGIEIAAEDGTIKLDKDTTLEFVGLDFDPVPDRRIVPPPEAPWALDPSVRYEVDNEEFWDGLAEDITGFAAETNIDLELTGCMLSASLIGCMKSAVSILNSGTAWFKDEIEKDFGVNVVITPKTIFFPDGTEFSVDVADDGSTTVTVFDGRVIAIDLDSRKIAVVGVDEQLTTGSEVIKIDSKSIDMWWLDIKDSKLEYGLRDTIMILGGIFLMSIVILAGITFVIKKKSGKKTKAWGKGSLVLGIWGVILIIFPFAGLALSLGAIYFYTEQKKINPTGLAKAGFILGIIGIVLNAIFLYLVLF